jgi:hypothetical protein
MYAVLHIHTVRIGRDGQNASSIFIWYENALPDNILRIVVIFGNMLWLSLSRDRAGISELFMTRFLGLEFGSPSRQGSTELKECFVIRLLGLEFRIPSWLGFRIGAREFSMTRFWL